MNDAANHLRSLHRERTRLVIRFTCLLLLPQAGAPKAGQRSKRALPFATCLRMEATRTRAFPGVQRIRRADVGVYQHVKSLLEARGALCIKPNDQLSRETIDPEIRQRCLRTRHED
jgi:hypothetical protein